MKLKDNRGSALVVVLIVVVLLVLGGIGYWVWHKHNSQNSSKNSTTTTQSNSQTGTTTPNPAPVSPSAVVNPCGDLSVSKGTSEGTAGTIYWHEVITNNGSLDCKLLNGYPTNTVLSDDTLNLSAAHNPLYPASTVTIPANGGKAHVVVGLPDPGNFPNPSTTCTVASKTKLELSYGALPATIVDSNFKDSACKGLTVTTIQSGV